MSPGRHLSQRDGLPIEQEPSIRDPITCIDGRSGFGVQAKCPRFRLQKCLPGRTIGATPRPWTASTAGPLSHDPSREAATMTEKRSVARRGFLETTGMTAGAMLAAGTFPHPAIGSIK